MKITLLQTDIHWAQPEENIMQAERMMSQNVGSDLYVLPEMWSTGFATEPQQIAHEEADNIALCWMQDAAHRYNCAICGSVAVHLSDGTYRNRHYFVDGRTGMVSYYDKRHLFTYGHENECYTPGRDKLIVNYQGWRMLILTCYDLRFPCWSRYATGSEYDVIIIVANWPESRQEAWQVLTQARAIENQCYVLGVNRIGKDPYCEYSGGTSVVDAFGFSTVAPDGEASVLTKELDLKRLKSFREKFPVLKEMDSI
jgi:predicted amidohydrolase